MNLTEKVLAKLDADRVFIYRANAEKTSIVDSNLLSNVALCRQVEKHNETDMSCGNPECCYPDDRCKTCDESFYPCTFIKEVATDLGISE